MEEFVFKDLHYLTNKYLENLGSVEFNKYMLDTFNSKLNLGANTQFQTFLVDLFVNSIDASTIGRIRALPLEKFVFLLL